jgi:hypothetical protein
MENRYDLKLWALLTVFFFVLPGTADTNSTPTPTPTPTPAPTPTQVATVEVTNGKPVIFRFKDGREATLKSASIDSELIKSVFQVADNNCSNRQNMKCTYNFMFRLYRLVLIWTKNPDGSRLGKPLNRVTEYMGPNGKIRQTLPIETPSLSLGGGPLSRKKYPSLSIGLPSHEIECDDFSWLPGGSTSAPATLHVSRWDGEDNVKNPETGFGENRTVGGGNGVELVRSTPHSLRIESVNALTGSLRNFDLFNLSPTLSLTMYAKDGEICQTGLSSNLAAEAQVYFPKLLERLQSEVTPKDYIIGSDQLMEQPGAADGYKRWLFEFTTVATPFPPTTYE